MALRQTKKISELTALTSASLQTTLLGVDNGTTYKVTLDVLEDAIINMVSRSTDLRLDSLEAYTASANVATDITLLNSFTSSQNTLNSAFTSGINARLQTSSFNDFSTSIDSRIIAATNEQSFNGLVSGSSQLTSSLDSRYVLSGSITQTTWDNIANKPSGIVSQSTDLSSLNTFTQSIDNRVDSLESWSSSLTDTFATDLEVSIVSSSVAATIGIISQNTGLVSTSSFNSYTASITTASLVTSISNLNSFTASQSTSSLVNRLNAIESVSGSWITESETGSLQTSITNLNTFTASVSTASLVTSISNLNSATSSYLTSLSGAISSSSQLTSSYDTRYVLSGSVSAVPSGTISGSAQITAFGFVSSSTSVPAGTISGSSQLTSSFDGRYTQTGSFNTLTASFNSFTASAQSVTTGSNSFNGTQTITGSLIITTGSFVASQILANTASLYLTSGSNMYVQNNGVVEITGSLRVSGSAAFNVNVLSVDGRSGDEGGEINLAIPVTNTTLQNRVNVDIWQNRLRIFEGSAGANGVFIDLSKPTGNNNEITYKASGIVNAGDFVTLDNIKAAFTTSGNRGLGLASVTGSFTAFITGTYTLYTSGVQGLGGNTTITTTLSTSLFGWSFPSQGDLATYIVNDTTNSRAYRITLMVGGGYNSNLITIERLH